MNESLDDLYLNWLHAKIMLNEPAHRGFNSYFRLLYTMFHTEFVWLLSGDDNRHEDGLDLRTEFIRESRLDIDYSWFEDGCSVLEMLIAFARRAEFQTDTSMSEWFWEFVNNLGLAGQYDEAFEEELVSNTLNSFVWRTYNSDGTGGLFPIEHPTEDQRKVEIFYQFSEYLVDKEPV